MTARQHPCPCPQTVDVWSISLASAMSPSNRPTGVLSPAEITRAERLVQPKDRQRFITARTALRGILGSYLGLPPAAVSFRINAHGKPYLDPASAMLQFNLSHSGDWALCAVTTAGEVGVDIERVRPCSPAYRLKVARRFFLPRSITPSTQRVPLASTRHSFPAGRAKRRISSVMARDWRSLWPRLR